MAAVDAGAVVVVVWYMQLCQNDFSNSCRRLIQVEFNSAVLFAIATPCHSYWRKGAKEETDQSCVTSTYTLLPSSLGIIDFSKGNSERCSKLGEFDVLDKLQTLVGGDETLL